MTAHKRTQALKRFRGPVLVIAGVAAGFCFAMAIQAAIALPQRYTPYRKLDVFAKALTYVENNYVRYVDDKKLIYGAIDGMLNRLDPHSVFLSPEDNLQLRADTEGEFSGIGIEVEIRNGWITIISPIEGTPACRAGLRPGDNVISIEGRSTENMTMLDAVRVMRGRVGTAVQIEIRRHNVAKPLKFKIVREKIQIASVTERVLERGIGYIRIKAFQHQTAADFQRALRRLRRSGDLTGLILDMRNNPGGLLEQAVRVSDHLLNSGVIVRTIGKSGRLLDEERAHPFNTFSGFPIVCLINEGSASAAEIVAGALQDQKRAVLLGERSFGKGTVQTIMDLGDGSAIKLTIAYYTTPSGKRIQNHGLDPEIVIKSPPNGDESPISLRADEDDAQLQAALRHLHEIVPKG